MKKTTNFILFLYIICASLNIYAQRDFVDIEDLITSDLLLENKVSTIIMDHGNMAKVTTHLDQNGLITKKETLEDSVLKVSEFIINEEFIDDSTNILLDTITKHYPNGITSKKIIYDFIDYKEETYYYKNKQLISLEIKTFIGWGKDTFINVYSYDSLGLIDTIFLDDQSIIVDKHSQDQLTSLQYDKNGNLTEKSITVFNNEDQPLFIIRYEIDLKNNQHINFYKTIFSYNKNRLLIKVTDLKKATENDDYKQYYQLVIHYKYFK